MDLDLDDLISTDAANNAKTSKKFQPKGKLKPKPKPEPNSQPEPESTPSTPTPLTQLVDAATAAATEEHIGNDVNQIVGNVLDSLQVFLESSNEEMSNLDAGSTESGLINNIDASTNLESIAELDSLTGEPLNTLAQSLTDSGSRVTKFKPKPKAHSRKMKPVADIVDEEVGPASVPTQTGFTENEAVSSSTSDELLGTSHKTKLIADILDEDVGPAQVSTQTGLTGNEPVCSFTSDEILGTSHKTKLIADIVDEDVGPVPVPTQTGFTENEPFPSFTPDELLNASPIIVTDSVIVEAENNNDVSVPEDESLTQKNESQSNSKSKSKSKAKAKQPFNENKKPARKRKKDREVQDELVEASPIIITDSVIVEAENNNDVSVPEDESLTQKNESQSNSKSKSKSKAKRPFNENKKPARKRKKDREVQDELVEAPKKKFSHSTCRNKNSRPVNPELLKIPEDEFELHMHNFPIKDLIRLREHRERIEKKEAALLDKQAADQSDDNRTNGSYYNYQTYMKITPRMRWTKQDTELFYQAIQQFGTDLSIIKECFPGRTREQIRAKFKKEYKQHRLRIESALNTRSKGYSHFEYVIERLKKAREEDSDNEDSIPLTGEEDDEMVAGEVNEGDNVGLQKEVKEMEPDTAAAAGESTIKSDDDIEDDTWSHYKSEI